MLLFICVAFVEDLPKPQGFVAGSSDDVLAAGTHCQVQHSCGVSVEREQLGLVLLVPNDDGVLRVPVGADELVVSFRTNQAAHLRVRVDLRSLLAVESVPKSNMQGT